MSTVFSKYSEYVYLYKKTTSFLVRCQKGRSADLQYSEMDNMLHKILDLLWKNNINEIDFCNAIGINKSAVTDWKKGKTASYKRHLSAIAEFLNVTTEYLTADNPTPDGNLNEIEYALYGEVRELDDEDKKELLRDARRLRELKELRRKQGGQSSSQG